MVGGPGGKVAPAILARMQISVVFTTYNSPRWLEKVVWGYECQHFKEFELVIADDGSDHETGELIERLRGDTGLPIRHVWHADKGFRKCRILNKAIVQARYEYVVFTDGDCIPRSDFLAEHAAHAERGCFLSGSYFKLPMTTSEAITRDDIASGRCFDLDWLKAHGLKPGRKHRKLRTSKRAARWLNRLTLTRCNLKGSNASVWRDDLLRVNGFDERMQWGGLDRELGVRLRNAGIRPKHVRYNAICIHLDHSRGYADPELVAQNRALRLDSERSGRVATDYGIAQL